jgi:hypothetical protein
MNQYRTLGALSAIALLALPASAGAHGSVYETKAKVGAGRTDEIRYVISNHGFTSILTEDNGLTGPKGMIGYNLIPTAWRTGKLMSDILATGGTGAQPHATCTGVPALESEATITGWQGVDPFYNYIPFQSTSAGLEDDPATWLAKLTAAGFDTTKLATPTEAAAECEKVPGAIYVRADKTASTTESLAAGPVEHAVEPLNTQIASLNAGLAAVQTQLTASTTELAAARTEIAGLMLRAKPLTLSLTGGKVKRVASAGTKASVTGPPLHAVTVTLNVSAGEASKLKLKSTVLGKQTATTSAAGTAEVTVKLSKAAAKALKSLKRSLSVTAQAVAGDRFVSTKSTLTK